MMLTVPDALFHGTTATRARKIDNEGLRTRQRPRWPNDGNRRYVYLEGTPDGAAAWAEGPGRVKDVVVYWVDISRLDMDYMEIDPRSTVLCKYYMWRYRRKIPAEALQQVTWGLTDTACILKPRGPMGAAFALWAKRIKG